MALLSDIIVPSVFLDYYVQRAVETSAIFRSGMVTTNDQIQIPSKGKEVTGLFWDDLGGADTVLDDATDLVPDIIGSNEEKAVILFRGHSWKRSDLAAMVAGSDPFNTLGNLVGDYWAERYNLAGISTLKGSLASNANVTNDQSANVIDTEMIIDTKQLMGDRRGQLVGMAMHSAVASKLQKLDLNDFFLDSQNNVVTRVSQLAIIEDDDLVDTAGVYTTILFSPGALVFNEDTPTDIAFEMDRNVLGGKDIMASRQRFIMHPFGYDWDPSGDKTITAQEPTNTTLALSSSWTVVKDTKNLRAVQLKHKIA